MKMPKQVPTIQELYPELSPTECDDAGVTYRAYLDLALRVYDRIREDPIEYVRFQTLIEKQQHEVTCKTSAIVDKKFESSPDV